MALDPQTEAWLTGLAESGLPPFEQLGVADARAVYSAAVAQHGIAPEPVADITERTVPGPGGEIPIRVYTPDASLPLPVLVYFHGGGWVLGDLDVVHGPCTVLANRAAAIVVSVDYRLAPEHPFPAAVQDAFAVTRWVADNAALLGADPERIAVGGDSAGGTLAAVTALLAVGDGHPKLCAQLLLYPATDAQATTASRFANGSGYFLTTDLLNWFLDHYLPGDADRADWLASPLRAPDVAGVAPAFIHTAEYDPLRDEGEAYGARLAAEGVPVSTTRHDGQIHAFAANLAGSIDAGARALEQAGRQLRGAFRAGFSPRLWRTSTDRHVAATRAAEGVPA